MDPPYLDSNLCRELNLPQVESILSECRRVIYEANNILPGYYLLLKVSSVSFYLQ